MNAGLLGKTSTPANTWVPVYTVPSSGVAFATADINCANTTGTAMAIDIAVTSAAAGSIATSDFIVAGLQIDANGIFGVTCKPISPGETVYVRSASAGVGVQVRGFEETAA